MIWTLIIILLILALIGGFPAWPHAANWGYGPSGVIGVILVILVVLLLVGRL